MCSFYVLFMFFEINSGIRGNKRENRDQAVENRTVLAGIGPTSATGLRIEDTQPCSRCHPAGRRRVNREYVCARLPVSRVLSMPIAEAQGNRWPFVWDARCRTPHATYPGGGAETRLPAIRRSRPAAPIRSCSRWGLPCRPRRRGRGALLPHPFTLAGRAEAGPAVCFLWHFPWGCPRRALPGTVLPWSPDFPPPAGFPRRGRRPSGHLAHAIYRKSRANAQSAIASRPAINPAVSSSAMPSMRDGRK